MNRSPFTFNSAPELSGDEPWLNKPVSELNWSDIPIDRSLAISILALREMPYSEYLRTNHWGGIRNRTMKRTNFQCVACNADALDAHHVEYKRKGFEHPEDVIATCRECHRAWHETWMLQAQNSFNLSK